MARWWGAVTSRLSGETGDGQKSTNLLTNVFYSALGIDYREVVAFFVFSGYFVGGGILKAQVAGKFSWKHYALGG